MPFLPVIQYCPILQLVLQLMYDEMGVLGMIKLFSQLDQLQWYPKFVMLNGLRCSLLVLLCGFSGYIWSFYHNILTLSTATALARVALSIMSLSIILSLLSHYVLLRKSS
jgi:hypothetical protein